MLHKETKFSRLHCQPSTEFIRVHKYLVYTCPVEQSAVHICVSSFTSCGQSNIDGGSSGSTKGRFQVSMFHPALKWPGMHSRMYIMYDTYLIRCMWVRSHLHASYVCFSVCLILYICLCLLYDFCVCQFSLKRTCCIDNRFLRYQAALFFCRIRIILCKLLSFKVCQIINLKFTGITLKSNKCSALF